MALVISLPVGQDFYIEDERIVVSWIESPYQFGLRVNKETVVEVTDEKWVGLIPGVRVMAGTPRNQNQNTIVKVMIDAPNKQVLRGPLYRKGNKGGPCKI